MATDNLPTINIEFLVQAKACYHPTKYLPKNWEGTILDLINVPSIPDRDKVWAFTRAKVVPLSLHAEFAKKCTTVDVTNIAQAERCAAIATDAAKANLPFTTAAAAYATANTVVSDRKQVEFIRNLLE